MQEIVKFGTGESGSSVHPLAVVALIITVIFMLILPRKRVLIPFVWFVFLIPQGQQFYVAGIHLYVYRIVLLVGLVRLLISGRGSADVRRADGLNRIDRWVTLAVALQAVAFSVQYMKFGAVINQIAFVLDSLGAYWFLRALIRDDEDIEKILRSLSHIFFLIAVSMFVEQWHEVNLFRYLGGQETLDIRDATVRSFGPFRHPLTAGIAGAAAFPLFLYLWHGKSSRRTAGIGMIASTVMTLSAHSSGPLIALVAGIVAIGFWPLRHSMRMVRWTALVTVISLHAVMKAPVWFLIARIDLTGSSSSYHRALLVDQFIEHFDEWWLIGTPSHYSWGWHLWDVQNQYVSIGVEGGVVALASFVAIIVSGFGIVGKARKRARNVADERRAWALGAALFSFMVALVGVNMFDQSRVLWLMLIAIISAYAAFIPAEQDGAAMGAGAAASISHVG